jgi:hypothetical protein
MRNNLEVLRTIYTTAKAQLGYVDKLALGDETRGRFLTVKNETQVALAREIRRVSLLVWPETGRPYDGNWAVLNRYTHKPIRIGDQRTCIEFIECLRSGFNFWIGKWPR